MRSIVIDIDDHHQRSGIATYLSIIVLGTATARPWSNIVLSHSIHRMSASIHGRLRDGSAAPISGEHFEQVVNIGRAFIEQILSGENDQPVDYNQDHDEWVVLLAGAAELEVSGEVLSLERGDWVFLPKRTPHRVVHTSRGTNWIAVRFFGAP